MAHIAIDLPEQSVHIHAQRELAFEVITAFGNGAGAGGKTGDAATRKHDSTNVVLEKKT